MPNRQNKESGKNRRSLVVPHEIAECLRKTAKTFDVSRTRIVEAAAANWLTVHYSGSEPGRLEVEPPGVISDLTEPNLVGDFGVDAIVTSRRLREAWHRANPAARVYADLFADALRRVEHDLPPAAENYTAPLPKGAVALGGSAPFTSAINAKRIDMLMYEEARRRERDHGELYAHALTWWLLFNYSAVGNRHYWRARPHHSVVEHARTALDITEETIMLLARLRLRWADDEEKGGAKRLFQCVPYLLELVSKSTAAQSARDGTLDG